MWYLISFILSPRSSHVWVYVAWFNRDPYVYYIILHYILLFHRYNGAWLVLVSTAYVDGSTYEII